MTTSAWTSLPHAACDRLCEPSTAHASGRALTLPALTRPVAARGRANLLLLLVLLALALLVQLHSPAQQPG